MSINETFYEIQLDSAGYIRDHSKRSTRDPNARGGGFGWQADVIEARYQRDLRNCVMTFTGRTGEVFVSNEIMVQVGTKYICEHWIVFGSRKLWKVGEAEILEIIEHNGYPRRNDREREVQRRNDEVIAFLVGLMK